MGKLNCPPARILTPTFKITRTSKIQAMVLKFTCSKLLWSLTQSFEYVLTRSHFPSSDISVRHKERLLCSSSYGTQFIFFSLKCEIQSFSPWPVSFASSPRDLEHPSRAWHQDNRFLFVEVRGLCIKNKSKPKFMPWEANQLSNS